MRIAVDKNQLTGSHKKSNLQKHKQIVACGAEIVPVPLPFGDYCLITPEIEEIISRKKSTKNDLLGKISTSIDTKKNIEEIWGNVNGSQHERFRRELLKPLDHGGQLVILIEHGEGITAIEDVEFYYQPAQERYRWTSKLIGGKAVKFKEKHIQQPIYGERLYKSMLTMKERYGVRFEFCEKGETGKRIIEILGGAK